MKKFFSIFCQVSPEFQRQSYDRVLRSRKVTKSFTKLCNKSDGITGDGVKSKFPPLQYIQQTSLFTHIPGVTVMKVTHDFDRQINNNNNEQMKLKGTNSSSHYQTDKEALESYHNISISETVQTGNCFEQDKANGISSSICQSRRKSEQGNIVNDIGCDQSQSYVNGEHRNRHRPRVICHSTPMDISAVCVPPPDFCDGTPPPTLTNFSPSTPIPSSSSTPSSSCQKQNEVHTILAADTPECDYGLGFRQRQLKYLLRPCNILNTGNK